MSFGEFQKVLIAAAIQDEALRAPSPLHAADSLWNPEKAGFRTWALPYIASIPLVVAALSVLWLVLRPLLPRAPSWASNFVKEAGEKERSDGVGLPRRPWPRYWLLLTTSLIGLVLSVVMWSRRVHNIPGVLVAASWIASIVLILLARPHTFSASLLILYASIFVTEFTLLVTHVSAPSAADIPEIMGVIVAFYGTIRVLFFPFRSPQLSKEAISKIFDKPDPKLRSPEDDLTPWQWMTVSWLKPLLAVGKTRQLNEEDIWFLGLEFHHRRLHDAFRELRGSVLRRLLQANGLDLIITSVLGILESLANTAAPVLLQQLLRAMQNPDAPRRAAITYALLILAVRLLASQASVFSLWYCRRCYERSRGEMITMLYEKTLARKIAGDDPTKEAEQTQFSSSNGSAEGETRKGSRMHGMLPSWLGRLLVRRDTAKTSETEAKQPATMGKILNLMRNDVYEVSQRFWEFRDFVTTPVELVVSVILIWVIIGRSCLLGVLTVVISQSFNFFMAKILVRQEKKRRVATDKKLQIIAQFIEAIRHLRWYGWQGAWLEQVIERRQQELNLMIVVRIYQLMMNIATVFGGMMFPVVAFYAYTVLFNQPLKIDVAFPAIQLFSLLDDNVRRIPNLITVILNAVVAVGRIEAFMNEPDKEEPQELTILQRQPDLKNTTFAWPGSGKIVLRDVSLSFPIGMTVVGGKVGSGKTALLLSMLGELDMLSGDYQRSGDLIGYCEQRPWLQSMTIRDNILFHEPYDDSRYKEVLEACALTPDLADFQYGDLSAIGENGIGLSGGQRARVALARAVYSRARILFLDDPLSALDHQTAESIVNKCFRGPLMTDRTLILVTHRLDLCRNIAVQYVEISESTAHIKQVSELPNYSNTVSTDNAHESAKPADEKLVDDVVKDKFMEEEHRAHGGIEFNVYWQYIKAGKYRWWAAMIISFLILRIFSIGKVWFLKEWGEAYNRGDIGLIGARGILDDWPNPEDDVQPWILGFFIFATLHSVWIAVAQAAMFAIIYCAGRQLFKDVIRQVAHANFRFYDVTPIGRLMNRMTSDIGTIDGSISRQFQDLAAWGIVWISSMVVIASVTPYFLIFAIAMTLGFITIFLQFLPTSQSLRRLEMTSLSPLLSDFGALLDGLTTVRAFRKQSKFEDRVIAVTDNFQRMDHFYWSTQAWLMYRLDNFSATSIFLLTVLGLFTGISPGLIAFALTVAGKFVAATHGLCAGYGKLQMDFVSVERVVELIRLDNEPPGEIDPPASWPTFGGDIVFDNATIRYAEHLDPALSNVSLTIKGGSTTAIVGRTGSGKSTLAAALLATIAPEEGTIWIDGQDISRVNKQALRTRLTFLAQDPVLFPGTIRQNLDPVDEHMDEDCEHVLQKVCGSHDWKLESKVDTGGRNFSQGQRQLIGLARAILRRSAIVILDEATASIDIGTSMKIQDVLREEMQQSTVITIAHRVEAVKDAESCIVLEKGRLLEHRSVTAS